MAEPREILNDELSAIERMRGSQKGLSQSVTDEQAMAELIVAACVTQIDSFPVSFETVCSCQAVDVRRVYLQRELRAMLQNDQDLIKALTTLDLFEKGHPAITWALKNCEERIAVQAEATRTAIGLNQKDARDIMQRSAILEQLLYVNEEANKTEIKAKSNDDYKEPAVKGRELHTKLQNEKDAFLMRGTPKKQNLATFKSACREAIDAVKQTLEKVGAWKKILANFVDVLLSIGAEVVQVARSRFSFFQTAAYRHDSTKPQHVIPSGEIPTTMAKTPT